MSEHELSPCPFCGGEAEVHIFSDGDFSFYIYHRDGCIMRNDLDGGIFDANDLEWAVRAWNTRDRDDVSYDAGFDSGVKACLQQLEGKIAAHCGTVEIEEWIGEQWKEHES